MMSVYLHLLLDKPLSIYPLTKSFIYSALVNVVYYIIIILK